jgi:nitrate/nitrite transporter NarK
VPRHGARAGVGLALWLGAVLAGASVALMGVAALAPTIVADLGLSPASIGLFSATVWVTALLVSPAGGALVGRWGAWTVSRACVALCALGAASVASGHPAGFWIGAMLIGLGQGIETPPSSQLLGRYTAPARRPLVFSLKQTGVQLGAVLASLSLPVLAVAAGWRVALVAVAASLVALAVVLGRAASRWPAPAGATGPAGGTLVRALRRGLVGWWPTLRARPGLARLACAAAAFGATQVCLNTFLVTWMVQVRGLPLTSAGLLAATAQGAGLLARPLWGWVASRGAGSRRVLAGLGATMAACGAALGAAGAALPTGALAALVACYGLSASGWNGVFLADVASRSEPDGIAATSAAATVPLFLGLVAGPLAFAAVGGALGLSAGFVMVASLGAAGTLLLPRDAPSGG